MKTLLIIAAVLLTSCAAQTGYVGQKNPNRKGSSKGHKCNGPINFAKR
jgi:hypothetical protein